MKRGCDLSIFKIKIKDRSLRQLLQAIRSLDELLLQRFERMHRRELRELCNHVVRRMEQNPGIGLAQHGGVVVGIPRRDNPVVEALEGQDRLTLGIF